MYISATFVPRGPMINKFALVQVMACHQTGAKSLPELKVTQFNDAYMRHHPSIS